MDTLDVLSEAGILSIIALAIAFLFEAINGFHDTANAVATVIYTHTLKPIVAVVLSGICNALGVLAGGTAVAYTIVQLLPVDLLVESSSGSGLAMVLALLLSAIIWNLGTWYFGLPSSSSHALIGAILGIGLVHSGLRGVNWHKAYEVLLSLLLSPVLGFFFAMMLLLVARRWIPDPELYEAPKSEAPPPWWIRGILMFTCSGVSFAHGSNDGQKGMGLIMLVLIGLIPSHYAVNIHAHTDEVHRARSAVDELGQFFAQQKDKVASAHPAKYQNVLHAEELLGNLGATLTDIHRLRDIEPEHRWKYRAQTLKLREAVKTWNDSASPRVPARPMQDLEATIEYIPLWVIVGVALALGLGTMVGWKRIVITVGEKIGKSHLSYGQGACAELVAMGTIALADQAGLPVSTTHVLSSGVAGTMWANNSGLQSQTLWKIATAWCLTLPTTILLAAGLFTMLELILGW